MYPLGHFTEVADPLWVIATDTLHHLYRHVAGMQVP